MFCHTYNNIYSRNTCLCIVACVCCVSVCDMLTFPLILEKLISILDLNVVVQIIANISFKFSEFFPQNIQSKKIKEVEDSGLDAESSCLESNCGSTALLWPQTRPKVSPGNHLVHSLASTTFTKLYLHFL